MPEDLRPLRILLTIHHELDPDTGAPGSTLRLASALREMGHRVRVVGFESVRVRVNSQLDSLLFPPSVAMLIARDIRRGLVDVVDASTGDIWPLSHLLVAKSRVAVVTRSHGLEHIAHREQLAAAERGELRLSRKYPIYHGGLRLWQVARSMRLSDAVLFLNVGELEYAVENLDVRADRSHIVRNGIPGDLLNLARPTFPRPQRPIDIAVIGSFLWRKGSQTATAVLTKVLREHPEVTARWLGTGASEEEVNRAFPVDIRDRLTIVEKYDQKSLAILLKNSQILLFTSWFEGFSLALVEAMACGLAPVASDISNCRDLLSGTNAGILVRPGEVSGYAAAIDHLIKDPKQLYSVRNSAYGVAQECSWNQVAADLIQIYRRSLAEKELSKR